MRVQTADPSHEMIPGVVVNMFRQRVDELLLEADFRFGIKPVAEGGLYLAQDTTEEDIEHDRARYRTLGRIVDVVSLDLEMDDEDNDSKARPVKASIQTAIPETDRWPNSYIEESFLFGAPGDFGYTLGASHYTADGQAILLAEGRAADKITPGVVDLIRETHGMSEVRDADSQYKGLYARSLDEFAETFPDTMKGFQSICTLEHFNETLKIIKAVRAEDEIGVYANPFVRT